MEYHEAVNRLERLRRLRPKLGTETTASLLAHLNDPHEDLTCVQIAGSNGKGSTARLLESILAETGLDVGCYTSPDLNGLRERIRVGDQRIPRSAVTQFVERVEPYVLDRSVAGDTPTYFEVLTAMALWQFARRDVDVAVLEVGIGGRHDATSVVDPRVAAVTSISLEHTDIIGSTVEEIAADKASVAPDDAPLVTGATGRALETIRGETAVLTVGPGNATTEPDSRPTPAAAQGRPPRPDGNGGRGAVTDVVASEAGMASRTESTVAIRGPDWAVQTESPLLGEHQAVNAGIAATLARQVANPTDSEAAAGIRNVRWPGRFEVMGTDPLVVLDGAHNPAACETVTRLLERFDVEAVNLVFGAMRDKDHVAMCRSLPAADGVYVAEATVDRAQDAATLGAVFERERAAAVERCQSVTDALERALDASDPSDCVLVTGSLSVVAEARDRWTRHPTVVRTDTRARARAVLERADVPARTRSEVADSFGPRTVRFHARPDVASDLRAKMLALGGTGAVSGIQATDQHVQTVLSGTRAQFADLVHWLRRGAGDQPHLGRQLATALSRQDRTGGQDDAAGDGTAVMGMLDVTPEAGHDGEPTDGTANAVERARAMVDAGAAFVCVGGGSTRPSADPSSAQAALDQVVPVVERLADLDATPAVQTSRPAVAAAAVDAGAEMVVDPTGLTDAGMRRVVAERGVSAVLRRDGSAPLESHDGPGTDDVVRAVVESLTERVLLAERAGIDRSQLVVDPGLDRPASRHYALLDRLDELHALGTRVLVSHADAPAQASAAGTDEDRLAPTVAATALATERGADVVAARDVAPHVAAIETARRTVEES